MELGKSKISSSFPGWPIEERTLVALSGLSMCGAIGVSMAVRPVWPFFGSVLVLVAGGLLYTAFFFILGRGAGHRLLHWIVAALSLSIALIPTPLAVVVLMHGSGERFLFELAPLLIGGCVILFPAMLFHACLFGAAAACYRQQGGDRPGILVVPAITIAVTVAAASLFLARYA